MSEKIDNIKKILDNSSYFYKKDNIYVDKRTEDYAVNFGLQWNKFALTQYDSFTGLPLTRNRLINSSEWKDEEINKKLKTESIRIFLRGDNLFTITSHDGIDPEQTLSGLTNARSSLMKTVSLGLNIKL